MNKLYLNKLFEDFLATIELLKSNATFAWKFLTPDFGKRHCHSLLHIALWGLSFTFARPPLLFDHVNCEPLNPRSIGPVLFHETPKSCPKTPYCNHRAQQYKANPPHLFTENSDQNQKKKKKKSKRWVPE